MRVTFRAPPPANPARIPVNASDAQYNTANIGAGRIRLRERRMDGLDLPRQIGC
jgi:hypothetical protein